MEWFGCDAVLMCLTRRDYNGVRITNNCHETRKGNTIIIIIAYIFIIQLGKRIAAHLIAVPMELPVNINI